MKSTLKLWHLATAALLTASTAGPVPAGSCHDVTIQPIQLREQDAHVTLRLGFSRTELVQRIYNPNAAGVEAVLHVPVPEEAALAEVEIGSGWSTLKSEAVASARAEPAFSEEAARGAEAAIARRIENGDLEIRIARLAPQAETYVRCVYYAPHALNGGEGRYIYPARSATELPGREIWTPQTELQGRFRLTVDILHSRAITEIAAPEFDGAVTIESPDQDRRRIVLEAQPGEGDEGATITYRVEEPEGGAVDLVAYRPQAERPGVFMMAFTPPAEFSAESVDNVRPVLHFPGGRVFETTELAAERLERGEQQVVFGLYSEGGRNRVVLNNGAPLGQLRHDTVATFPVCDEEFPELERVWAQGRLRWLGSLGRAGVYAPEGVAAAEARLGEACQILTPSTAFLALDEKTFETREIERGNAERVKVERLAQANRENFPVWQTRVDLADAFFTPRGRQEGDCCRIGETPESLQAYGMDLSVPSTSAQMAAQPLRYW